MWLTWVKVGKFVNNPVPKICLLLDLVEGESCSRNGPPFFHMTRVQFPSSTRVCL